MTSHSNISTILLAAGSGDRVGGNAKAFLKAGGATYLSRLVSLFADYSGQIIVALSEAELEALDDLHIALPCQYIVGGKTRQDTIELAVPHCSGSNILVHDVARPFVPSEDILNLIEAVKTCAAVTLTSPIKVRDSLTYVENEFVSVPVARENLYALKTPQAYQTNVLVEVLSLAKTNKWREASLVPLCKKANISVKCLVGSKRNIKVTYPEDVLLIDEMLNAMGTNRLDE
ncbi:hypothetical protein A9Q83_05465 [Alphaproteobacteria bacterium 46_93_T64]|nr:hypothetical protein A9Q83_05465 [Alphaproteobacteria bacterium 46_93_T64]